MFEEKERQIDEISELDQENKVWFGGSPRDFGAPDGSEISNKDSILQEIDEALGVSKPPDIEYIFVEPYSDFSLAGIGIGRNPYGHAALRYTLPSGEQILMNIVGVPGRQMVNFLDPVEYLYGTGFFEEGAEQRGVYNRTMVSVRIEQVEPEKILAMHKYFQELQKKSSESAAEFSLLLSPVFEFLSSWLPFSFPEKGNCAMYTSRGLKKGRISSHVSMWPKAIWVGLFEDYGTKNPENVHVVCYRRVRHACRSYGDDSETISPIAPIFTWGNFWYLNLERFANIIVEVPAGTTRAEICVRESPARPSFFKYHRYSLTTSAIFGAILLLGGFTKKGRPFVTNSKKFLT
jgi:hypothetical protein